MELRWRLLTLELRKLLGQKRTMALILVLLAAGAFLRHEQQLREQPELIAAREDYEALEASYAGMSEKEGHERAEEAVQRLKAFQAFSLAATAEGDSPWSRMAEEALAKQPELLEAYRDSIYVNDPNRIARELFLQAKILEQYEHFQQHRDFLTGMASYSETIGSYAIFAEDSPFLTRNRSQTVEDFRKLEGTPYGLGLQEGVVASTEQSALDLLDLLILFLIASAVFLPDRTSGLRSLQLASPYGRLPLFGTKLTVLLLAVSFLALASTGLRLADMGLLYGFGDATRPLVSMPAFQAAAERWTVGEFLALYVVCKLFVQLVLALLLGLLFLIFRQSAAIFGIAGLLAALQLFLYESIHPASAWNWIKWINLAAWTDSSQLLAAYENLSLLGYPVSKRTAGLIALSLLALALPAWSGWLFCRHEPYRLRLLPPSWIERLNRLPFRLARRNSLLVHELRKLLVSGKAIFAILAACILCGQLLQLEGRWYEPDDAAYNGYLSQLGGELTESKLRWMDEERQRLDRIPSQLAQALEQLRSGKLDPAGYFEQTRELETLGQKEKAFQRVEAQRDELLKQRSRGVEHLGFVNRFASDSLFDSERKDLGVGLWIAALLLVGISPLAALDRQAHMEPLLHAAPRGREKLLRSKLLAASILGWAIALPLLAVKHVNSYRSDPSWDSSLAVQSIESLARIGGSLSIREYMFVTGALQAVMLQCLVLLLAALAIFARSQTGFLIQGSLIFLLPLALHAAGLEWVASFSFTFLFHFPQAFDGRSYWPSVLLACGLTAALAAAGWRLAWVRYVHDPSERKGRQHDAHAG
ncbi:hypothetical protein HGI30_02235 [Paenibacillus albicereus]|uniref:Uncharacterized protein n=1 Tax=Paenibacillus albicereus TaxID=2726185 RepID=A0A6H2GTN2_9BACL|nr:hypothetical protein [Paenibacillus albicereus]QJC50526.1 hypothetical protein HGI30_02235 [Paenibacillus albicereus]